MEVVVQPPQQLQQVLQALQVLRPHAQLPQPQESHLPKVQQMGASSWPYEFVLAGLELPDFSQLGAFFQTKQSTGCILQGHMYRNIVLIAQTYLVRTNNIWYRS